MNALLAALGGGNETTRVLHGSRRSGYYRLAACSARAAASNDARRYHNNPTSDVTNLRRIRRALRELGYIEGQNLVVDLLNPQNQAGGIAGAVAELLRRKVDIIVAPYESTLKSAIAATASVPIVMIAVDYDPLALGYIKSLSRPGGPQKSLFVRIG